jgi:hypothetical protein
MPFIHLIWYIILIGVYIETTLFLAQVPLGHSEEKFL